MRLLSVGNRYPPWSLGGYETIWQRTTGALRADGHHVRVLSTAADPSDEVGGDGADPDTHRDLRWYWREHRFPPIGLRACAARERANAATLTGHISEFSPDAVIWWAMGGMSLSLLEQVRRAGLPALGVVGDEWMLYGPGVDAWMRRWRGWRRAGGVLAERVVGVPAQVDLDRVARWAFISEHLLGTARASGLRLPEAVIAHPGVDPLRFAWREPGEWRWRLLYCGRVDPRKGVSTAVQALAHLPAEATLTVDGSGSPAYLAELGTLARRLGVGDRVLFQRTPSAQVMDSYAAADAVVFPVTWREPWGLVPLEAMAVGRPVIASRAGGGPAEYLEPERNCVQFEPGDGAGLAQAVRRVAASAPLRAALLDGGRATTRRFTERAFQEAIERELRALVGPR